MNAPQRCRAAPARPAGDAPSGAPGTVAGAVAGVVERNRAAGVAPWPAPGPGARAAAMIGAGTPGTAAPRAGADISDARRAGGQDDTANRIDEPE